MFSTIVNRYGEFSDASVFGINYNSKEVELFINCRNLQKNYESGWENIKLIFFEVQLFRFIDFSQCAGVVIQRALLKNENNLITIDFFPLIFEYPELREDSNSELLIKCKKINCEVVSVHIIGSAIGG